MINAGLYEIHGKPTSTRIWSPQLLKQVEEIVFPWPTDERLNGSEIGRVFFLDNGDAHSQWDREPIKAALRTLVDLVMDGLEMDDLIASTLPHDLSDWRSLLGAVLLLDQGPRYLCRGKDARYVYHFFEVFALGLVHHLLSTRPEWFTLKGWTCTGLAKEQSIIRILMLLAPLVHSEDLVDQRLQINLVENLRQEYETHSGTIDPHRDSFASDLKNIHLTGILLASGPPQGNRVKFHDYVYWHMRYYTAHGAYVDFFARSPFRNVAVGRKDSPGEVDWLHCEGVYWSDHDESVRQDVSDEIRRGTWAPLQL